MRLFVILSITTALTLTQTSAARLSAIKRRRESKWDIIHHEYHGPPAPLSKDGRVVDTPEVAEARKNHLAIHAETVADLARKMAEANALEAKWKQEQEEFGHKHKETKPEKEEKKEEEKKEEAEAEPKISEPIVAAPVEMTPELMALLMEAAAQEAELAKIQEEAKKKIEETVPASEAAPEADPAPVVEAVSEEVPEPEAPASEAAPEEQAEVTEEKEEAKEKKEEEKKEEEKKKEEATSVSEPEITNEVIERNEPVIVAQPTYEGPLAPLGEDGRVLETTEVRKAKEAHLIAYEQAVKLAKAKAEEDGGESDSPPAWYELRKWLYVPPVNIVYHPDGPIGYRGPSAPIGRHGLVIDTEEVELAKEKHRKALEQAEALSKRGWPPKVEENAV